MVDSRAIGIFGGTFDPVHFGHLRAAVEAAEKLPLAEFRLLPAGTPPHRAEPHASGEHRLAMLALAIADYEDLKVDDREVRREGYSYMVDTLAEIRAEEGDAPLVLMVGQDAVNKLDSWHKWERIFDLAHLVAMRRPGSRNEYSGELFEVLQPRMIDDARMLARSSHGSVLPLEVTSSKSHPPASASSLGPVARLDSCCRNRSSPTFVSTGCTREQRIAAEFFCGRAAQGLKSGLGTHGSTRLLSKRKSPAASATEKLRDLVVSILEDLKAIDIHTIDVRGQNPLTDLFVVASGTSNRHVKSMADKVVTRAKERGLQPLGIEGYNQGDWVLVDLNDVIVHLMLPRTRAFYNLEKLWEITEAQRSSASAG